MLFTNEHLDILPLSTLLFALALSDQMEIKRAKNEEVLLAKQIYLHLAASKFNKRRTIAPI